MCWLITPYIKKNVRSVWLHHCSTTIRRFRIQYLKVNGDSTSKQISEALNDISVPTLYRHINKLLEENVITVKEERKVRGTIERVLSYDEDAFMSQSGDDIADVAYQFLMTLYASFREYTDEGGNDPVRDRLSMRTFTVRMTDEAMDGFLREYKELLSRYMGSNEGKLRSISFISAPVKEVSE